VAPLVRLRFVHHAGAYNPNEIAGFVPDVAARLVRLGVAYPVDQPAPDSDELAAMAAEQLAFGAKAGRSETGGGATVVPAGALEPATNQRIALAHQLLDSQAHPGGRQGQEVPEAQAAIEGIPPMTSPEISAVANEGPGGGARVGEVTGGRHGPSTLPTNAPTVDDPGPSEADEPPELPDEPPSGARRSEAPDQSPKARASEETAKARAADAPDREPPSEQGKKR
jgi:hypothetical protein